MEEKSKKSLIYRASHRSTKEADLIFGGYVVQKKMTDKEWGEVEHLLSYDDPQIFDWLGGVNVAPEDVSQDLLQKLQNFIDDKSRLTHLTK